MLASSNKIALIKLLTAMKTLALTLFFIALMYGEGLAGIPSWVTSPPEEEHVFTVVGVATGRTIEEARRSAVMDAALQIVQYIEDVVQVKGSKIRTEIEHKLMEEVKFSTREIPLRGGLIKEWSFRKVDEGYECFVLVQYPKGEIKKIKRDLQKEKEVLREEGRVAIIKGDLAWKKGRIGKALRLFTQARELSRDIPDTQLRLQAGKRIVSLLKSLEILPISERYQTVKASKDLRPLAIHIVSHVNEEEIPAIDVPVKFIMKNHAHEHSVSLTTDENGEAWIYPSQLGIDKGAGLYHVNVVIDQSLFDTNGLAGDKLPSGGIDFTIKVLPVFNHLRVLVIVDELNIGVASNESIVGQSLSEALLQAGFRIIALHEIGRTNMERLRKALRRDSLWPVRPELASQVRLVIYGSASTRRGSSNMGIAISAHADVYVKAIDMESGEIIAQKNVTGMRGFGDTLKIAGIRALKKASEIVSEDFVEQIVLWKESREISE